MTNIVWIIVFLSVAGLFLLLYSLLKVAHDADEQAGYMEEYGIDFDDEDDDMGMS